MRWASLIIPSSPCSSELQRPTYCKLKHETCGYLRVEKRSHGIKNAAAAAMSLIVLNTNPYPYVCHTMLLAVLISSDVLVILEPLSNVGTVSRILKSERVYVLLTAARNRDDSGVVSLCITRYGIRKTKNIFPCSVHSMLRCALAICCFLIVHYHEIANRHAVAVRGA